jgi:hypothetical protein
MSDDAANHPSAYQVCESCRETRAEGRLEEAHGCRPCKGTGMVRDPKSFTCNGCGEPLCPKPNDGPHGLIEATVSGGYDSPHLLDLTAYTFSLCEKCLRQLFDGFKVPPKVVNYHDDLPSYAQERERYRLWQWRKARGNVSKVKTGLCNATIECPRTAVWRVFTGGQMTDDVCCDEHKSYFGWANSLYVPAQAVAGLLRDDKPTSGQATQIASAFLSVAARPGASATFFKFVPQCIADLVEIDWRADPHACDETSAMWIPAPGSMQLGDFVTVQHIWFADGQILVGPAGEMEGFASLPGVRAAAVLPHLESEMAEEQAQTNGDDYDNPALRLSPDAHQRWLDRLKADPEHRDD